MIKRKRKQKRIKLQNIVYSLLNQGWTNLYLRTQVFRHAKNRAQSKVPIRSINN